MTKFNQEHTSASGSSINLNMYNVSFCEILRHHLELLGCESKNTTELLVDYPSWKLKGSPSIRLASVLMVLAILYTVYIYISHTSAVNSHWRSIVSNIWGDAKTMDLLHQALPTVGLQ